MQAEGDIKSEELEYYFATVNQAVQAIAFTESLSKGIGLIRQGIREGFNSSADPQTNIDWTPRKSGGGWPLLVKTGKMMQAATGGGAGSIGTISGKEAEVGVSGSVVGYAAYHQDGTKNEDGSLRMVARPFVGASDKTLDAIGELIAEDGLRIF